MSRARNFEDDRHVLFAGMLWGLAMRHGLPITVITDEHGNYTPRWRLDAPGLPEGVELTIAIPPPPETLDLAAWLGAVTTGPRIQPLR